MESLNLKFGILDITDTWQSVLKFDEFGLVDSERALITGGSAGGYITFQAATTLASLFPSQSPSLLFKAGIPQCGVSDMRKIDLVMRKVNWKFLWRLFGSYDEHEDVWRARSPIFHADNIEMPMLVCQLPLAIVNDISPLYTRCLLAPRTRLFQYHK